jgi:ParB-like chromosome segregation protein Spo0J
MIRNTVSDDRITFGGKHYHVLFPNLFRPLNADEDARLEESIRRYGIQVPLFVDEDLGVIGGAHRLRKAVKLKLRPADVPTRTLPGLTAEQKKLLAESLNRDRRQLTPEQIEQDRLERVDREVELKEQGKTLREIAEIVGVTHTTVRKDLREAAGNQFPGGHQGEKVVSEVEKDTGGDQGAKIVREVTKDVPEPEKKLGADGKRYPTHKQPAASTATEGLVVDTVDGRLQPRSPPATELHPRPAAGGDRLQPRTAGETKPVGVGMQLAHEAIACLRRIPANDAFRKAAWSAVREWLDSHE